MTITQQDNLPLDTTGTPVTGTPVAGTPVTGTAVTGTAENGTASPPGGETSMLGRWVAVFTPVFVVFAAWGAGRIAQLVPGAHLDQSELVSLMVASATAALAAVWKWFEGWHQHELLVAENKELPLGK